MRKKLTVLFTLIISTELFAASCPTDAVLHVECNDKNAIRHIQKKHCKNPGNGPEQFVPYYCQDLVKTCSDAIENPDAKYPNNCYKKGENNREIVGYLSNGEPTNCYQANFVRGKGVGTMVLKTMYPVNNRYCIQR